MYSRIQKVANAKQRPPGANYFAESYFIKEIWQAGGNEIPLESTISKQTKLAEMTYLRAWIHYKDGKQMDLARHSPIIH